MTQMSFTPLFRPGRLLWTLAVTFYCGVFFHNFLVDADGGSASVSGLSLMTTAVFMLLLWMATEYYFGAPFFQSGIVEPHPLLRVLFALFVYPLMAYAAADSLWFKVTVLPTPPLMAGLPGVALLGAGCSVRLISLFSVVGALWRQQSKDRSSARTVLRSETLARLRLQRLCRQPRYFGTLLQLLGITLVFNSWGGLLLVGVIGFPLLLIQARIEDLRIRAIDPASHSQYAAGVPLMIPRLGR